MLTDYEVEGILRDDLRRARRRVQQSLATFLIIAGTLDPGAPELLNQAALDHSAARNQALAAGRRLNMFCLFGIVPEHLEGSGRRVGFKLVRCRRANV